MSIVGPMAAASSTLRGVGKNLLEGGKDVLKDALKDAVLKGAEGVARAGVDALRARVAPGDAGSQISQGSQPRRSHPGTTPSSTFRSLGPSLPRSGPPSRRSSVSSDAPTYGEAFARHRDSASDPREESDPSEHGDRGRLDDLADVAFGEESGGVADRAENAGQAGAHPLKKAFDAVKGDLEEGLEAFLERVLPGLDGDERKDLRDGLVGFVEKNLSKLIDAPDGVARNLADTVQRWAGLHGKMLTQEAEGNFDKLSKIIKTIGKAIKQGVKDAAIL